MLIIAEMNITSGLKKYEPAELIGVRNANYVVKTTNGEKSIPTGGFLNKGPIILNTNNMELMSKIINLQECVRFVQEQISFIENKFERINIEEVEKC
jgi:hypothetical protein